MNRVLVLVAALAAAGQTGCASARYVQRGPDEGVVAIPDRSNGWPAYNHDKAVALIKDHVGSDYEIVEEWADKSGDRPTPPPTRDVSTNNQLFFLPSDEPRNKAGTPTVDATEWRIRYRRKSAGTAGWLPTPGTGGSTAAAVPAPGSKGPPMSGSGVVPAAFQAAPLIAPLVLPAGGIVPAAFQGGVIPPPVLPAGG